MPDYPPLVGLSIALGVGLLVGAERERRKGTGPTRSAAGIRTFALTALAGAAATLLGGGLLMAVVAAVVGGFALLSYRRAKSEDPGTTSEIALVLTCLCGGICVIDPLLGASVGTALAALLASRERLHHFVRQVMSERELHDAMVFAAVALIALPLAPDRYVGPFGGVNPRALGGVVVLVLSVSALGYVLMRVFGSRAGLPLAGLVSGFVSSTATIHSMGARARSEPGLLASSIAAATLSSIATVLQLAAILALLAPRVLAECAQALIFAAIAAVLYGGWFARNAWHAAPADPDSRVDGRAFDLRAALGFVALVAGVQLATAYLQSQFGAQGALLASAVSGLADAHAAASSVGPLAVAGKLSAADAAHAVLAGFSANALVKSVVAWNSGGRAFAARVVPGLAAMVAAAWLGAAP